MKKFITLFATVALLLVSHICQGQIHFSKTANVYDDSNNAKVGQHISLPISLMVQER